MSLPNSLPEQLPTFFNIGDACTRQWAQSFRADTPAIIVHDSTQGESSLTFRQLNEQTDRLAAFLIAREMQKSERVLIRLPNCLEYPVAFLGVLKAGGIAVPASPQLSPDELEFLLKDSGASVAVLSESDLRLLLPRLARVPDLRQVIVKGAGAPDADLLADGIALHAMHDVLLHPVSDSAMPSTLANDPAYLVYTSGTTGYPKGVLHAHRALLGRLPAAADWFDYRGDDDRILHTGKFNWTYVLGTALMDPLYQGKSVVVHEGDATPETWIELIRRYECTIFIGVPTLYRQILQKTVFHAGEVPTLRHCMCAGEHLSDEVQLGWQARFGAPVYEAIGMSECSYYLSQSRAFPVRPGSAGRPQRGHQVALLNRQLQPVGDEEEGMLCIHESDPGLFLGYWQREDENRASRQGAYFLTGDYARRDADGYFWFLGRKDDLINSFGYRISPHEVERVLKTFAGVADCVVVPETVGDDKTLIVACIIRETGSKMSEADVLAFCAEHLARYKMPRKVYFLADFPRTRNGKVLRRGVLATVLE